MPHINLIHEQRAMVRKREAQARAGLLVLVGSLGVTAVLSGVLLLQQTMVRGEEDRLKAELARLEPLAKQIQTNVDEQAALEPRVKTLSDAREATSRWRRILDHLAVNTPGDTWLTTVRANADDPTKPVLVTVGGMGMAQAPIGELLMRTQNSRDLDNVNLRFTEERVINATKAISFEFLAEVNGTSPEPAGGKK